MENDVNDLKKAKKNGNQKKRILRHTLAAAGVLILLVIALFTLGWFTNNKITEVNGANGQAVSGKFELAAVGTDGGLYKNYLKADDGKTLSDIKDTDGNALNNLVGTGNSTEIKWVMNGESNFQNNTEYTGDGIQPGSKGKLTFYVIPKQEGTLNLKFSLDTILYNDSEKEISPENDNSDAVISSTEEVAKLVKGHILFFENKSETDIYSDRIDGTFTRTIENAKADTAYPIDIYWVWPNLVDELVLPTKDTKFVSPYNRIIGDSVSLVKADEENFAYFFGEKYKGNITQDTIENVSKGSSDAAFNQTDYNNLTDAWNNADQTIGVQVRYIELQLIADENKNS